MILNGLVDLLFPRLCESCSSPLLSFEKMLCVQCRHEVSLCNWDNYKDNIIIDRLRGRVPLTNADALFYFEKGNIVQDIIHNLKYKGQEYISSYIGLWHAAYLKEADWIADIDLIVPVPIHKRRKRKRGYNQVKGYAKTISQQFGIRYEDKLLFRKNHSPTQVFKNRIARTDVIEHNFYVNPKKDYSHKHIVLVDDLITTGATAEACFIQLMKIPNVRLHMLVMAIAV